MSNEVRDLLQALHDGGISVEEVAEQFRERQWPRRTDKTPTTYMDMLAAELGDPGTYMPESFDDVIAAYDQKLITRQELRILSEAAAEAQRAEDAGT